MCVADGDESFTYAAERWGRRPVTFAAVLLLALAGLSDLVMPDLERLWRAERERTPFHISRNELAVADERRDDWRLVRLWNFARNQRRSNCGRIGGACFAYGRQLSGKFLLTTNFRRPNAERECRLTPEPAIQKSNCARLLRHSLADLRSSGAVTRPPRIADARSSFPPLRACSTGCWCRCRSPLHGRSCGSHPASIQRRWSRALVMVLLDSSEAVWMCAKAR